MGEGAISLRKVVKIAIVEDEDLYADQLNEFINKYADESHEIIRQVRFYDGDEIAEKYDGSRVDYAIRGYEVDALDYIVKPVSYFSFARKLERAISRIPDKEDVTITLNYPQGMVRLRVDDIFYAESEGHNLVYHTGQGEYRIRRKMSEAENELVPHGFFRSNKGYLVNLKHVDGVQDGCCLIAGQKLLISRSRKADFMLAMMENIGSSV